LPYKLFHVEVGVKRVIFDKHLKVERIIDFMQAYCQSKCSSKRSQERNGYFSFLPGILMAIIPKCPFCILSYTSAITVCSAKNMSGYASHWTSWISIAFALITFMITAYNYKGWKTQIALLLISAGCVLVIYSELFSGLLQPYYWGCSLLIIGIWLNGSLLYFVRKLLKMGNTQLTSRTHG
jgi:cation transport ATPase